MGPPSQPAAATATADIDIATADLSRGERMNNEDYHMWANITIPNTPYSYDHCCRDGMYDGERVEQFWVKTRDLYTGSGQSTCSPCACTPHCQGPKSTMG